LSTIREGKLVMVEHYISTGALAPEGFNPPRAKHSRRDDQVVTGIDKALNHAHNCALQMNAPDKGGVNAR
jgi:hypothetical protein